MAADTADNHMIWLIDFVITGPAHISCFKGADCDSRTVDIAFSHVTLTEQVQTWRLLNLTMCPWHEGLDHELVSPTEESTRSYPVAKEQAAS